MAEKKPVFMPLYFNAIEVIEKYYDDSSLKELIMAMYNFYLNGEMPNIKDKYSQIVFEMIKPNLEKSRQTYTSKIENGSKGGAPKGNQNAKKKENSSKINLNQPNSTENNKDKEKEKEEDKGEEKEKEKEKDVDVEEGEDNYFSPLETPKTNITTTTTTSFNISTFLYDSFVVYWYKYPRKNDKYYQDVYNVWRKLNPDIYEMYDILSAIDNYYKSAEDKKRLVFAKTFIELDEDDNRMYERFIYNSKKDELSKWLDNYNNNMGEPWKYEEWQPGYEKEEQQHQEDYEKASLLAQGFKAYESKLIEEFYKEYKEIIEENK